MRYSGKRMPSVELPGRRKRERPQMFTGFGNMDMEAYDLEQLK